MKMTLNKYPFIAVSLYMIIFSSITTFLAQLVLGILGLSELLPKLQSYLLANGLAVLFGLLFYKSLLINNNNQFKTFLKGCGLFLLMLPLFDLGALYMMQTEFNGTHTHLQSFNDYITLYFVVLIYSILLVGSWLAPFSGLLFIGLHKLLPYKNITTYT